MRSWKRLEKIRAIYVCDNRSFQYSLLLTKKFKATEKEKYVLILGLGVFDVFCSLFFRLNWLSYALQIVVVAAYFVYEQRRIKVRG